MAKEVTGTLKLVIEVDRQNVHRRSRSWATWYTKWTARSLTIRQKAWKDQFHV